MTEQEQNELLASLKKLIQAETNMSEYMGEYIRMFESICPDSKSIPIMRRSNAKREKELEKMRQWVKSHNKTKKK